MDDNPWGDGNREGSIPVKKVSISEAPILKHVESDFIPSARDFQPVAIPNNNDDFMGGFQDPNIVIPPSERDELVNKAQILQESLLTMIHRVEIAKAECLKISKENITLTEYVENLMNATGS